MTDDNPSHGLNHRQLLYCRSTSSTRPQSSSSQSSTTSSRPGTPPDPPHKPPPSRFSQRSAANLGSVEDYWLHKSPPESRYQSPHSSSSSSLEEPRLQTDDYQRFIENAHPRLRTNTITPATVRHAIYCDSDRMRMQFPRSTYRDSSSSTDSRPSVLGSESGFTYDEDLGGIPTRHPLRNRVDSKGSSLLFSDSESRPGSPAGSLRAPSSRPESGTSPPRTSSASLRLKSKKSYSRLGARTLLKSLGSSPNTEIPRRFEDVEFDWAEQRRQELEERANQLELEMMELRVVTNREPQLLREVEGLVQGDPHAPSRDKISLRPKSWELTPEELALRKEQREAEARKFILRDNVWVNRSYLSAHPKDAVPYPLSYDNVNLQNDRHSHNLVKQLFYGRPSIHDDPSKKPPSFVLDLGCGDGTWILSAAHSWPNTRFYGLDLQNLQPSRQQLLTSLGETADNIKFTYYNFLLDKLPYLDDAFDLVRMANLKWAIPEDKWDFIFQEIHRVLRRGGWVEIIDDDYLSYSSFENALSSEQRSSCDMLESQFADMLTSRNLLLNTGSHFLAEKLGRWFFALHQDHFPLSISMGRAASMEGPGQAPMQAMPPAENLPPKAAKLMGLGFDSNPEKHRSAGSARSRSRSGSVSSGVSSSSGRDPERFDDRFDDQPEFINEVKREIYQPLGLDVHHGRFIPFPPAELSSHAIRNMQSVLASKEAIRAEILKKDPELEALEVKAILLPNERPQFDKLSWEWNERQNAFDDAFWEYETMMLKRLCLPQRSFDIDDDNEHHHTSFSPSPRLQPPRTSSGLSKLTKVGDGSPPSLNVPAGLRDIVRLIRVHSGWK